MRCVSTTKSKTFLSWILSSILLFTTTGFFVHSHEHESHHQTSIEAVSSACAICVLISQTSNKFSGQSSFQFEFVAQAFEKVVDTNLTAPYSVCFSQISARAPPVIS